VGDRRRVRRSVREALTGLRRRRGRTPGLAAGIALTYVVVATVFFGAGYLLGRLVL
jgi:hypothetical protein